MNFSLSSGINPRVARRPRQTPRVGVWQSVIAAIGLAFVVSATQAQPSGLNNIPTADTTPDKTLVLQGFSVFGEDRKPGFFTGFKFGLTPHELVGIEFGLLGQLGPEDSQNLTFHAKLGISPAVDWPRLGGGIANVAFTDDDQDDAGAEFPYAVISHDFEIVRLHGGYKFQEDNEGAFVGIDRTFDVWERKLTLRADAIQIEDESDWLGSFGLMFPIIDTIVFEGWISKPFDGGDPVFTLKLNYVIRF